MRPQHSEQTVCAMSIPNLHDRRALEEIVARMDTKAIGASLDEGQLSQFAREVVAEELARRVLSDERDFPLRARSPTAWVLDRTMSILPLLWYLVWVALCLGRLL
jgi:hypothetical protein